MKTQPESLTDKIVLTPGGTDAIVESNNFALLSVTSESIRIRNLGPLKDIAIDDIKPFTIFIGESAGGKSVIMKTIALFRWLFKRQNLYSYLQASMVLPQSSPWGDIDKYLEYAGLLEFVSDGTEILYAVTFDNEPQPVTIQYLNRNLNTGDRIPVGGISYSKLSYIPETRGFLPYILNSKGSRPRFETHFEEMVEDFEKARAVQKDLNIEFLRVRFSSVKGEYGWEYRISGVDDVNYKIGFHNSASGIQNTVPMLLLASYFAQGFNLMEAFNQALLSMVLGSGKLTEFRPISDTDTLPKHVFLHIEEPELGLFPKAQCDLLNHLLIFGSCEECNPIRFMLTTHSPYILNHLNLLIKAHDTRNTQFTEGASLNFDDIAAYHVTDGGIDDLKRIVGKRLIDTDILSDPINDTYDRFEELES